MEFDSMGTVEDILSSALGRGILSAVVYALIAGVIIFIIVKLIKQGIETLKTRALDFAENLRESEESKRKLLEWANKQDLLTQKQKDSFAKIAKEKAEFELSLSSSSHSDEVITWRDRIVKTKESYNTFKNKKALQSMPDSAQKNVAEFLMDNFLDSKGQTLKMQIGKQHGTIDKLDKSQFQYMLSGLLTQNELEHLNQTGEILTKKKVMGHEINIKTSLKDGTIVTEWIPKDIEKIEKVKEVSYVTKKDSRGAIDEAFVINDSDFDIDIGFGEDDSLEEMLNLNLDLDDINLDDINLDNMDIPSDLGFEQEINH